VPRIDRPSDKYTATLADAVLVAAGRERPGIRPVQPAAVVVARLFAHGHLLRLTAPSRWPAAARVTLGQHAARRPAARALDSGGWAKQALRTMAASRGPEQPGQAWLYCTRRGETAALIAQPSLMNGLDWIDLERSRLSGLPDRRSAGVRGLGRAAARARARGRRSPLAPTVAESLRRLLSGGLWALGGDPQLGSELRRHGAPGARPRTGSSASTAWR
jgi:hypothetical protein